MTAIDTAAEIDIVWDHEALVVRIPLAGEVTPDWCDQYRSLARGRNLPATAERHPRRSWIIVTLQPSGDDAGIQTAMDAARDLIAETDNADGSSAGAGTEAALREWWARQRG